MSVYWFEGWYQRLHPRVVAVVSVACGDSDLAKEAADEAFIRALSNRRRLERMQEPDAWVCRVALNVMRRRVRRRAVEARLLARRHDRTVVESDVPHPEVWEAVRSLPERQRLAIVLRYVGDLPESEIASIMGVTRGSVSASLVAARSTLAVLLEGLVFDLEPTEEYGNA
jgi:RNA polymerase sigma-70 factor (ECF subfamily)